MGPGHQSGLEGQEGHFGRCRRSCCYRKNHVSDLNPGRVQAGVGLWRAWAMWLLSSELQVRRLHALDSCAGLALGLRALPLSLSSCEH